MEGLNKKDRLPHNAVFSSGLSGPQLCSGVFLLLVVVGLGLFLFVCCCCFLGGVFVFVCFFGGGGLFFCFSFFLTKDWNI